MQIDYAVVRRARLSDAPAAVREAVADLLGSPIRTEHPAPGGFTASTASVVMPFRREAVRQGGRYAWRPT